MPTSRFDEIPLVLKLLVDLEPPPRRVLDVGIGNGKFGFLCREYLRYWGPGAPPAVRVDGIEAFPAYVGPLQRAVYDHVYIGDAAAVLPTLPGDGYDLVLLIDVIEHFTREQGAALLAHCRCVGTVVIVGTPGRFEPQGDAREVFRVRQDLAREAVEPAVGVDEAGGGLEGQLAGLRLDAEAGRLRPGRRGPDGQADHEGGDEDETDAPA